jgi:hypothetical protein
MDLSQIVNTKLRVKSKFHEQALLFKIDSMHIELHVTNFFTCSKTDQFLSQAEELQVRLKILAANFLRFGVLVPWFSHHFAT